MRLFFRLFALFFILTLLALASAVWLALSNEPLVVNDLRLSHQDIARAQVLLRENDPRRLPPGTDREVEINEADLNLAASYLLHKLPRSGGSIKLDANRLDLQLTLGLPLQRYLNIDGQIREQEGEFTLERLKIGQLPVPQLLVEQVVRIGLPLLFRYPQLQLAQQMLDNMNVELHADEVRLTYRWDQALFDNMQSTLLQRLDREAVSAYYHRLLALLDSGISRNGSLTTILQPMFKLAEERSSSNDPVVENAALLSVLATWALGQNFKHLLPSAREQPYRFRLKLQRRIDFAQHFLGSAALSAQGDSLLADAVGTFKEVADSDHGSGFSFTDLAADRAGVRFGDLASQSTAEARRVQGFIAAGIEETDIMPQARDLPEYLGSVEFKRRYGEVGSDSYNAVLAEIEQRINACRIYH